MKLPHVNHLLRSVNIAVFNIGNRLLAEEVKFRKALENRELPHVNSNKKRYWT